MPHKSVHNRNNNHNIKQPNVTNHKPQSNNNRTQSNKIQTKPNQSHKTTFKAQASHTTIRKQNQKYYNQQSIKTKAKHK